jgi:hypothetical protein
MANVWLAAALLSGSLAVSGCLGPYPGGGAYGYGGGYPSCGNPQSYPYDPGVGGDYSQAESVPQATGGDASSYPGRWLDRRWQRPESRISPGRDRGQLTPREARRLPREQGRIRGAPGRMRADGHLSPQERARLHAMHPRNGQDIYRLRHNGVQAGPRRPGRPMAELRPAEQRRAASQPRAYGGRLTRNYGGAP